MPEPFIGVCGVTSASDFAELLNRADVLEGTGRFMMAGVKQVSDENMIPGKYDYVRPFMHCDFTGDEPFEQVVERNVRKSQKFVRGLQLNVLPWMEVDFAPLWHRLKAERPDMSLMLQAHRATMEQYTPTQIAARLVGLPVDYILFDASQSRGVVYDLDDMRAYVGAVRAVRPDLGIVVAGGLEGSVMSDLFAPLARECPGLSCDAFGQLQDEATQRLSWPRVDSYLAAWKRSLAL